MMTLGILTIGSQTLRASKANPEVTLRMVKNSVAFPGIYMVIEKGQT